MKESLKKTLLYKIYRDYFGPVRDTILHYLYDLKLFWKYSGAFRGNSRQHRIARLIMLYHSLEKGLSLDSPRQGFGAEKVSALVIELKAYLKDFGREDVVVEHCLSALRSYSDHSSGMEISVKVNQFLEDFDIPAGRAATTTVFKDRITAICDRFSFEEFTKCRHSIRNFSDDPVDEKDLYDAIRIAQKTPSVCNRQTSRVHILTGEKKNQVLAIQAGSRGFSERIHAILIVTSDRRNFVSIGERNQCWVDSGMFWRSLVYALHSLQLGTCCLNWSLPRGRDIIGKRAAAIPEYEAVAMIIAVGHIPQQLEVARSNRLKLSDIVFKK